MLRRRLLHGSALLALARLLAVAAPAARLAVASGASSQPEPGGGLDLPVEFRWNRFLAVHAYLRVLSGKAAEPPAAFARPVAAYRHHSKLVPDPRIWFTLESYIAKAVDVDGLRGQVRTFPLEYRAEFDLKAMGEEIGVAILESREAFEQAMGAASDARRRTQIDPMLERQWQPNRKRIISFVCSSLNAEPPELLFPTIDLVPVYVMTGHDTRDYHGQYFSLVETERFTPLGVMETIILLLIRILELEDRANTKGALFILRQKQGALRLPNPALFPRAVQYWTAGEAVRRIIDPAHVHVGETLQIYQRGLRPFLKPLREVWNPYLDGKLGLEEAIQGMIERVV